MRESFGRSGVPQGYFLMAEEDKGLKGGRDRCCASSQASGVTPQGRTSTLAVPTEASGAAGRKSRCKWTPHAVRRAQIVRVRAPHPHSGH